MKRIVVLGLVALWSVGLVWAADFEVDGISYKITEGTKVEVTAGTGTDKYTGAVVIPSSVTNGETTYTVTAIGSSAFSGCSGLTSVEIPNSVTSIGMYAFQNCSGLTSVEIPDAVTSIGNGAFYGCSGLTSFTIPDAVKTIGRFAFSNCSGLASLTIGRSVTSIENDAFGYCPLRKIYTYATVPPTLGSNVFDNVVFANAHLYVPQGSVADYKAAETWKEFRIAPFFTVTVSANDEALGTVTGGGEFASGATATLTATPKAGHKFVKWSDGETANPRTVAVTSNLTLVAEFAKENVAIEDLSGRNRMTVTSAQGTIYVRGAEGVPVSVYNMSGICLFRENGRALTEVAVPAPGIYIVKAGAQTVKVAVM